MRHIKAVAVGAMAAALLLGVGCRSEVERQQDELNEQQGTGGAGMEGTSSQDSNFYKGSDHYQGTGGAGSLDTQQDQGSMGSDRVIIDRSTGMGGTGDLNPSQQGDLRTGESNDLGTGGSGGMKNNQGSNESSLQKGGGNTGSEVGMGATGTTTTPKGTGSAIPQPSQGTGGSQGGMNPDTKR